MDTSTWIGIGLIIFFILFGMVGTSIAIHKEKKSFNNGKCTECNEDLKLYRTLDQGRRYYVCSECKRTVSVSYNQIDEDFRCVEEKENG